MEMEMNKILFCLYKLELLAEMNLSGNLLDEFIEYISLIRDLLEVY